MRNVRFAVVAGLAFFAAALVARAEPLDMKQVPADATWLVQIDADAARASTVVKKAYEKCMEMHKDAAKHLDTMAEKCGFDFRKDLHSITVYGKDFDKQHGVAVIHATVNKKLLLEKAEKATEHKVTEYGSYKLHSWTQKCHKGTHPVTGVFYKDDVLVFAGSVEAVKAAIDVLEGKAANASGSDSALAGRLAPGAIFIARASKVNPNMRCPVLKQAESFRVSLGENEGKSFYRARIVMKSTEAVDQLKSIVDGFKALVQLKHGADADVLIKGLSVTTEEKTIRIRWSASADDVWAAMEKAGKKWQEWKKAHPAAPGMMGKKAPETSCKDKAPEASCKDKAPAEKPKDKAPADKPKPKHKPAKAPKAPKSADKD